MKRLLMLLVLLSMLCQGTEQQWVQFGNLPGTGTKFWRFTDGTSYCYVVTKEWLGYVTGDLVTMSCVRR